MQNNLKGFKGILLHFLCLGVLIFVLSGCGSKEQTQEIQQTQKRIESAKEQQVSEPPASEGDKGSTQTSGTEGQPLDQTQEYSYDATGKPDPFKPLIAPPEASPQEKGSTVDKIRSDKPLTPLQRFDLAELFLVGIMLADNNTTALIEDSAHNGYIVKEGMMIGKNDGIIKKILKDKIIVEEQIADRTGKLEKKITTLTMHTKD